MQTLKTYTADALDKIIRPYHDRIIVDRDTPARFTESGFEIPGSYLDKPNTGIILSVGARCNEMQVGMYILFGRNSGTELTINDKTLVVMHELDAILQIDPIMPFADRLLIEPAEPPKVIKGIHIPDNVQEQPQTGIIRFKGIQCSETVIGENVLFGKFAGMRVTVRGKEYLCVREKDVFARLD